MGTPHSGGAPTGAHKRFRPQRKPCRKADLFRLRKKKAFGDPA